MNTYTFMFSGILFKFSTKSITEKKNDFLFKQKKKTVKILFTLF